MCTYVCVLTYVFSKCKPVPTQQPIHNILTFTTESSKYVLKYYFSSMLIKESILKKENAHHPPEDHVGVVLQQLTTYIVLGM